MPQHIVFGYRDAAAKGEPVLLYGGPERSKAVAALAAGGEGIVRADYLCDPTPSQTKRFMQQGSHGSAPAPAPSGKDGGTAGAGLMPSEPEPQPEAAKEIPPKLPLPPKGGPRQTA